MVWFSIIRPEALHEVSEIEEGDFDRALDQLLEFKLLEPTFDGRFITHSMTRAFARREMEEQLELRRSGERAFVKYFLKFVEQNVKRNQPAPAYWNALVSDQMRNIDPEWSCIQAAINWASDDELVEFVMLLAHYMDSRFLNAERMEYTARALEVLSRSNRKWEEALLRIDGISWTLVETDQLMRALEEIDKGLEIAKEYTSGADRDELIALGSAWKARVMIELNGSADVSDLLNTAKELPCRPWIKHRVHMAAGDVAMGQERFQEAYDHYQLCANEVKKYGEEGNDYQIALRLGFAYLGLGDLQRAKQCFEELAQFGQIIVGRMYAEYGVPTKISSLNKTTTSREASNNVT